VVAIVVLTVTWFLIAKLITTSAVGVVSTSLTLMLYLLVPWTTVNLMDFFFVRRGHYSIIDIFKPHGVYGVWSPRGLLAYGIGFACEIPFMVLINLVTFKSYFTGPLAARINGVDIAWIVGIVTTGIAYWLVTRGFDVDAERDAIAESERELRQIDDEAEVVEAG
jgi:purine-cytosine permease-like protein